MLADPEPDILECEDKWALGTITMNKARGGDGIRAELFWILKDDAIKVLHAIGQQGTSLVVQWLRLQAPNTGGFGSIPGQGTRFHMLQRLNILQPTVRPSAAK